MENVMTGETTLLFFAVVAILLAGAIVHGGRFRNKNK
jgi:LPXTG-motif cell wall-anchored protein